jgi:hypothetical protein
MSGKTKTKYIIGSCAGSDVTVTLTVSPNHAPWALWRSEDQTRATAETSPTNSKAYVDDANELFSLISNEIPIGTLEELLYLLMKSFRRYAETALIRIHAEDDLRKSVLK